MKYGMRRKIDDDRRTVLIWSCLGLVAAGVAGWFGYGAWMHPYRLRGERLGEVIREGETLLARFEESLAAADRGGLGSARERMLDLVDAAEGGAEALPEFRLDTGLYVASEQMTAERLLEEHAAVVEEYAKARVALRNGAAEAASLVGVMDQLLGETDGGGAADARSDLAQSLLELKAVRAQVRPAASAAEGAERRFNAAQRKASEARARISRWTVAAQQALADANAVAAEVDDAVRRTRAATERSRVLREEGLSLSIDPNSAKLTTLQEGLRKGESDVAKALEGYGKAKREADAALGEMQQQARERCQKIQDAIQGLVADHGSLLPEEKVQVGVGALERVQAAIHEQDARWRTLDAQGRELIREAETLRGEAGGIRAQLENVQKRGQMGVDGVRAAALAGELAAVRGKLAATAAALGTEGCKRQLDGIVAPATEAMRAVLAAKPDVPKLLAGIRTGAASAVAEIERAQSEKERLDADVRDGRGTSKAALLKALEACGYPAAAVEELSRLTAAEAATGRAILALRGRLAKAQEAGQGFVAAVGEVRKDQEAAEAAGRFFPVSWEEGAIGGGPGKVGVVVARDERVLTAVGAGPGDKSYEWEFDLEFASPGMHRIEVQVAKPNQLPVNESIDRLKRVLHENQAVNGGWVDVECRLQSSAGTWYLEPLWMPNYNKLPSQMVVAGQGNFAAGRQTFTLTLNLASSPAVMGGWHMDRLQFTVFVDGQPVPRFWHKAR